MSCSFSDSLLHCVFLLLRVYVFVSHCRCPYAVCVDYAAWLALSLFLALSACLCAQVADWFRQHSDSEALADWFAGQPQPMARPSVVGRWFRRKPAGAAAWFGAQQLPRGHHGGACLSRVLLYISIHTLCWCPFIHIHTLLWCSFIYIHTLLWCSLIYIHTLLWCSFIYIHTLLWCSLIYIHTLLWCSFIHIHTLLCCYIYTHSNTPLVFFDPFTHSFGVLISIMRALRRSLERSQPADSLPPHSDLWCAAAATDVDIAQWFRKQPPAAEIAGWFTHHPLDTSTPADIAGWFKGQQSGGACGDWFHGQPAATATDQQIASWFRDWTAAQPKGE